MESANIGRTCKYRRAQIMCLSVDVSQPMIAHSTQMSEFGDMSWDQKSLRTQICFLSEGNHRL